VDLRLSLPNDPSAIQESCAGVLHYLEPFGLNPRTLHRTEVILEELVSNIVRHAGAARTISIGARVDGGTVELTVADDGSAFDPFALPEPKPFTSLEHAKLGGQGILLVRKLSASRTYERAEGRNRVSVSVASA
jgi:serine/threonine-protein kinase RsbW